MSIFSGSPRLRNAGRAAARWLAPVQPRRGLLAVGRRTSPGNLTRLRIALAAVEQGRWLRSMQPDVRNVADRFALFTEALPRIYGERPLYLEFGVYRGRSLRWWSAHLTSPTARLVGFDSFQGLPENWQHVPKGTFDVCGAAPVLDDPRVSFVAGWFAETLPAWELPEHDQLIVNIDCDLYSSTACVLEWLTPHLRPGSLIYFDDLLDPDDEMRALREWLDASDNRATAVAMARWGQHMLFEWRGPRQAATDRPAAPQPPHHFAGLPGQPTAGLPGRSTATPSGRSTAELPGQAAPAPSTVDGR